MYAQYAVTVAPNDNEDSTLFGLLGLNYSI